MIDHVAPGDVFRPKLPRLIEETRSITAARTSAQRHFDVRIAARIGSYGSSVKLQRRALIIAVEGLGYSARDISRDCH